MTAKATGWRLGLVWLVLLTISGGLAIAAVIYAVELLAFTMASVMGALA